MNPENPPVPPSSIPGAAAPSTQPSLPTQPQPQFQPQPQVEQVSKPGRNMTPVIAVVLALAILGGIGYFFGPKIGGMINRGSNIQEEVVDTPPPVAEQPQPIEEVLDPQTQLEKDIQSVTNKANNVDEDLSNIDKGLNDQPIPQGQ